MIYAPRPIKLGTDAADAELRRGTADPTAGGGVGAPEGSLYLRDGATPELYQKIGAGGTDWALVGGGAGDIAGTLWGPRTAPHPADDEFLGPALDAAWLNTGFGGPLDFGTRPNPYVSPGAVHAASFENRREPLQGLAGGAADTWLRIQTSHTSGTTGGWQRLDSADFGGAVPANLLMWSRMRSSIRNAAGGYNVNDAVVGIRIFTETGTGLAAANHASVYLNQSDGTEVHPQLWARHGGTGTITIITLDAINNTGSTPVNQVRATHGGIVALQKLGSTYHGWLITEGSDIWIGSITINSGVTACAFITQNATNAIPANMITDIDFIRFYQGGDWIP